MGAEELPQTNGNSDIEMDFGEPTVAATQAPVFTNPITCNHPDCDRPARGGSNYCSEHGASNPFEAEPKPFETDPIDDLFDDDDDQLDRIERKLDALLDHLGVEVDDG